MKGRILVGLGVAAAAGAIAIVYRKQLRQLGATAIAVIVGMVHRVHDDTDAVTREDAIEE